MTDFPADFLWGSSTAAHQVEGDNQNNDWWAWEQAADSPAAEPSGMAIDHRRRYADDYELLATLGHNAHRISLEWSRIEPTEGHFDVDALAHYRRVLQALQRTDLTAFVTLYHFTLPRWFAERGGWLAPDAVEVFGRYVDTVATHLGDLIPYACTINEPQIISFKGYLTGQFPPGIANEPSSWLVNTTLMQAHRVAVAALRAGAGSPAIGVCLQLPVIEPLRANDPDDVEQAATLRKLMVDDHVDDLARGGDVGDFVGVQYYTRVRIDARLATLLADPPAGTETTQMGWEVYPRGFQQVLRRAAVCGLPIVVTENGIATAADGQRMAYLRSHLHQLKLALDDGIDIRGYLYWSAFDNFEWNNGYVPTFGLVGIDRDDDLRRIVRPSAIAFGRVARTGNLASLGETRRTGHDDSNGHPAIGAGQADG